MQGHLVWLHGYLVEPRQVERSLVNGAVFVCELLFQVVQGSAALRRELAYVVERHPQEAPELHPLGRTVRLRCREFAPGSVGVFERNLRPETRRCLDGDGTRLVLAPGLAEQACGALADEHPPIAERSRTERLPEVQLALAPG